MVEKFCTLKTRGRVTTWSSGSSVGSRCNEIDGIGGSQMLMLDTYKSQLHTSLKGRGLRDLTFYGFPAKFSPDRR